MKLSLIHGLLLGLALILGGLLSSIITPLNAAPATTSEAESLRFMRPGLLYSHQHVHVSAVSAASAALNPWSVYRVKCDDDVYMDQGISTVAATTDEAPLDSGETQYIRTGNTELYLAFIRKTNDCRCFITEER